MKPKIIFFDIDGTLVDPATGLIPESAYTALKLLRENGIMICIATGRPIGSLPDLRDQEFDAMVTFNGFMTVPNLIGIFLLTPVLLRLIRDHFAKEKKDLRA